MFCMEFPCSCPKPEKKVAPRKKAAKKKPDSSGNNQGQPETVDLPVAPPIDIAAAMKAAAQPNKEVVQLRQRQVELEAEMAAVPDDPDFVTALNALEPILHPNERERYSTVLSTPSSRAARWKARNASNG